MSKFTGVETTRLLSLLTEAAEKLSLLSHLPSLSTDPDANSVAVVGQQQLLKHLHGDPASVIAHQFMQEEQLLQLTNGGRLDLMHDSTQEQAFAGVKAHTRSLCRTLRHDPAALGVVTIERPHGTHHHAAASGLTTLATYFIAARDHVAHVLSTSVEQDEAQRQLMGEMEIRIREAENDYRQINADVRSQRELRELEVRRNAHKIQALRNELHDIEQGAEQASTLIESEAKQSEFMLLNGYEDKMTRGRDESDRLVTHGARSKDEHSAQEEGHRKRKLKAAVEVGNQIEQYDKDMTEVQRQIDEIRAALSAEVAEVHRLSDVFQRLDENYRLASADYKRWDAETKAREAKEMAFIRRIARLQASFRGYLVRKQIAKDKERKKKKKKKKTTKKK